MTSVRLRWNHYVYALILIGMVVGWIYFLERASLWHIAITAVALGATLVVGQLAGKPRGKI